MYEALPVATVRTLVMVPLRFSDGYTTTARVCSFNGLVDGREHLALALGLGDRAGPRDRQAVSAASGRSGDWSGPPRAASGPNLSEESAVKRPEPGGTDGPVPLVRVHSECLTGDVFGSQRCDCGPQLREAVERVASAGGYLLYLRQEGRGIGLYTKLDAYALQDTGLDTYEANLALGHGEDERDYTAAAQMLAALGANRVALLTNNPDKVEQLSRLGVVVTERVPTGVYLSPANAGYLAAKANRAARTVDLPLAS